jgi:hypothetical protein
MAKAIGLVRVLIIFQLGFGQMPVMAKPMTEAQKSETSARVTRAAFDYIVRQSAMVTSAREFEKYFLYGLKKSDRQAVMAHLKGVKVFPTFQRVGDSLLLGDAKHSYALKRLAVGRHLYDINGVKWEYDPALPLLAQVEKLQRRLLASKSTAGLMLDQLLPRAEALWFVPVILMLVGAFVGVAATDVFSEAWCWGVDQVGGTTQKCADLKRIKMAAMYGDAPTLDAVSNQAGSDNTNVLSHYEAREWKCPSNNDGKPREYRAALRVVETKGGATRAVSGWFNVVAKFNPQGFPTDVIISRGGSDPSTIDTKSGEGVGNLVLHIVFDPATKKPLTYRIPNPAFNPDKDLLGKPTLTLAVTQQLTPEQADVIEKAKDIIRYVNYRNYNCVAEQVESNQAAGIPSAAPEEAPADK